MKYEGINSVVAEVIYVGTTRTYPTHVCKLVQIVAKLQLRRQLLPPQAHKF